MMHSKPRHSSFCRKTKTRKPQRQQSHQTCDRSLPILNECHCHKRVVSRTWLAVWLMLEYEFERIRAQRAAFGIGTRSDMNCRRHHNHHPLDVQLNESEVRSADLQHWDLGGAWTTAINAQRAAEWELWFKMARLPSTSLLDSGSSCYVTVATHISDHAIFITTPRHYSWSPTLL
jgi:hypothetical protein